MSSITDNFLKTYADKTYKHTAMVRHKGKVVALAMDDQRHIYYSVLNLDNSDEAKSPLDVHYWLENPKVISFSNEIVQVGYGIVDPVKMPIVKKGSRAEAEPGTLRPEEIDPFLSTTARFTADAPFDALSDGKYIYIFRQSINPDHEDMVYARHTDGSPVLDQDSNKVPLVNDTLLVDRFVLAGTELQAKREVRYKRSRNKYRPQSNKDSLGAQDMEKKPFFEPTQELDFVKNLRDGRFSVLLLPTQIAGIQRWQVFSHNSQTGQIDSFNVERSEDGLFNTKGTQFYTSPDPEYQKSVFERQPGICPFTGQDLIPLGDESGIRRSSFELNGRTIESGISAILYYQQENAATGYDQQEKPIKKNARVMLAVGTGEEQNSSSKNHIGVLDLAVSREGKLGQVPDNITLPLLSNPDIESGSSNESLDNISNIEKKITRLQGEIKQLENSNQQSSAKIPGIDLEISKLDQQIKNLQQELSQTKNLRYKVRTYTGNQSGAGTNADVYVTLKGSLRDSREFQIDNSSDNFEQGDVDSFGPFDLGEIGSLERVKIRHNDSGWGSGWYLAKVVIDVYQGSNRLESLEFRCMRWLATDEDDRRIDRTLSPNSKSSLRDRVQIQNDINRKSNEQNNLRNQKNQLSSLTDGQELSKADKQKELSEQQKLLTVLKAQQGDAVPLPMSILHIDSLGLTLSGGLLNFAQTQDTPQLFDSATGKLALYFRGVEDQLFAAYYDTHTQKSQSLLPAETGNLTLIARSAEPELDESSITVSDGATPETCTVIIQNTATDITETWNNVPRDVEEFSNVLNGTANEKIVIGSLAQDVFGIVTTLTLEEPVKYPLNPGDILLVGPTQVQVDQAVERNSTVIAIASATVETAINTSVYLVPYDYPAQTNTNKTTYSLQQGSLQFLAFPGNAKGKVKNGTATSNGITTSCQWVPQSPGKALAFDGQDDYVGLQQSSNLVDSAPIKLPAAPVSVNSQAIAALQFNTGDYVNCGSRINLANKSFTVEFWAKRGQTSGVHQFMMLQGSKSNNQGLHIGFRRENTFTLAFYGDDLRTTNTYTDTEWHHWSCTYNSLTKERVIYCDGEKVASNAAQANYQGTGDLFFNNTFDGKSVFDGELCELRIWNRARTQTEIEADMDQPLQGNESGLVGYWRFEEGIAKDYSGNGHDGTYYGNPKLVDSAPVKLPAFSESTSMSALEFDGQGDKVDIPYQAELNPKEFTVSLWVKLTGGQGYRSPLTCRDDYPQRGYMFYATPRNQWHVAIGQGSGWNGVSASSHIALNTWTHLAATLQGNDLKLYVDGKLEAQTTVSSYSLNTARPLRIGAGATEGNGNYFFNGQIDEVQIWNHSRTQAEIQAEMNQRLKGNESGLVGYWRFEAGVAKDYSGNGHDGTYYGNPKLVDSAPVKLPAFSELTSTSTSALQFDGSGDYVEIQNYKGVTGKNSRTVEAWIKTTSTHQTIVSWGANNPSQKWVFRVQIDQGKPNTIRAEVNGGFIIGSTPVNDGQWHHVACTLENDGSPNVTDVKLYVDGQLETISAKVSCAINTAASRNVFIGNNFISRYFNGAIDEVRIWDRVRTQAEIQADMNQRLKGGESGLVGYWRFEDGVAKDYSGNGHDGTYHGNPKLVDSAPVKLPAAPVEVEEQEIIDFPTQLAKLDADGDLTLEAWINPSAVTHTTRIIHHHSPNSQYSLGLKPEGNGYTCFMGVGSQFKQSLESFKLGQWEHLAVVYGQSYGLQFNGSAYLSCDHNPTLDVTQDLTIEAFLQVNDLQQPQGILSKGQLDNGGEESVPYGLYIDTDGKIAFTFEDKDGNNHVYKSTQSLSAGQFYKIAVTRFDQTEVKDEGSSRSPNVKVNQWSDIRFYINQQEAGYHKYEGQDPGSNSQPLEIGKTYQGSQENYLKGILSELRLYNTALHRENLGSKIQGHEEGLIGWWRFEENEGNIAYDFKSSNHAMIKGAKWVKNPDPKGSTLLFYRNGSAVEIEEMTQELQWGEEQFTLGAHKNGNLQECFAGTMEEVRIWKVARTQEQIQDNLFTRLKGEKQDLIANYTFDLESETQLQDYSLLGNHLTLGSGDSKPTAVISTAPISDDIAQVRSALGGVETQFHDIIQSRPAIQEYGDLQYDIDGNLTGIHKRCYGYIKNGQWHLLTGYKVGNLVTEWIGQVQADPQIIGYIEGAPPVPSENLTATSLKLGEFEDYNGCSAVELEEAETVNYVYSSSKESGFDTSIETTLAKGLDTESSAGFGVVTKIADMNSFIGLKNTLEYSNSQLNESSVSYGRNTTKTSRLELRGAWEQAGSEINPAVGRRFIPANTGFALVQSDTMDVFALRLAHNNALVSYRMQPNPDIPKDWNIITFPLNNTYTKQGTLDGKVGVNEDGSVQCDPDYGNATTYGQYSYFKPIEAYSLKKRIERDQQELQTYYQSYNIDAGADTSSNDIPKSLASRNLFNTYVWTADGGFFSESTEVMESVQESTTGSYSFQGMGGLATEINASVFGVAIHFEMDALFGGHVETIKTKGKETEKSFGLTMEAEPESDIQLYVNTDAEREKYKGRINEGGGAYDENGNPILRPGKVDAYRFMSFYLEPTKDNFEDFFNKVIDPIWLEQSDAPNAVALRQANQGDKKPKCWRIMHRVTFVSRVLPEIEAPNAPPIEKAIRKVNIESNYELIKKLEPFVKNKTQDAAIFADAVRHTLKNYLPELQPFEADIIEYAALYFGVSQG